MVLAVAIGTAFDLLRDNKLTFFLQERQRTKAAAKRPLGGADIASIAARTLAHDIATFGEFCNRQRRISHVLMFYGFVTYLVTSVVMVFGYPADPRPPAVLPLLWNLGVVMALVGGYWFFFFLRVNVVHDGQPPWRLVRADLFIVSLLASVSFALLFKLGAMADNPTATRILALIMIALMTATTFITQRQLIVKNSAPDNPMVKQQKILLYVFPIIFAVSGINFPIGVLVYWFTTNLWSMGQQFYVIRNNPQPGTPAFAAKEARKAAKAAAKNGPPIESIPTDGEEVSDTTSENPTRQQPKKTSRSQRKKK